MSRTHVNLATAAAAALLLLVGAAGASAFPIGGSSAKPASPASAAKGGAETASDVLKVGGDVKEPVLVKKTNPAYPEEARKNRTQGRVVLQAVIDQKGIVTKVDAVESPDPMLTDAAIAAVKQWTYKPATKGGKPVKVLLTVTVSFKLT